jgi:hypothetical protein
VNSFRILARQAVMANVNSVLGLGHLFDISGSLPQKVSGFNKSAILLNYCSLCSRESEIWHVKPSVAVWSYLIGPTTKCQEFD